jgi:hypothetical protein
MFRPTTIAVQCPHCHTEFSDIPATYEKGGVVVDLDVQKCNDDFCTVKLCACCPQFACDACGEKFCLEHKTRVDDLDLCPVCTVSLEDLADPECECVLVDADEDDASDCQLHGPNSKLARWQREREAEDQFAFYAHLDPGVIQ